MTTRAKPHRDPQDVAALMHYFGTADPKKVKRIERKAFGTGEVKAAYDLGSSDGEYRRKPRNYYPPGRRHDEYNRGFWDSFSRPHTRY